MRLNPMKMEILWMDREDSGTGWQLLALEYMPLTLAQSIKNLGVILDIVVQSLSRV